MDSDELQNISHPTWELEGFEMEHAKAGWVPVAGPCHVYIVGCSDYLSGEPIKIGIATNPRRRLKALQQGSPDELRLFHTWTLADQMSAANFELELHSYFAEYQYRGEWFTAPWRYVKRAGDMLLAGRRRELDQLMAYVEDADLSSYLGHDEAEAWNMAEAIKRGYPDPDTDEYDEMLDDEPPEPELAAPPPYVAPKNGSRHAILAAYKEARGLAPSPLMTGDE